MENFTPLWTQCSLAVRLADGQRLMSLTCGAMSELLIKPHPFSGILPVIKRATGLF